jgi:hypothetical protein
VRKGAHHSAQRVATRRQISLKKVGASVKLHEGMLVGGYQAIIHGNGMAAVLEDQLRFY